MKRFVKEYANYQIDCIKGRMFGAEQKAEDIEHVKSIVKNYERGLVTINEAMKMLTGAYREKIKKMENNENKVVHGFKVFHSDWSCKPNKRIKKQYTCPGKFEEDVDPEVCDCGMHFCERAVDCFEYYPFDPANKVAEVIAYGKVVSDGVKSATNKLEIVREIPWDEVLRLVNIGENCTGFCNIGDCNTGDCNIGDRNAGFWNTGDCNRGNGNTGNRNMGIYNTGSYNTGGRNAGGWNTGSNNTGNRNAGSYNTGDWNKSSFNTGCFMTEEQPIMMFNKPSDWTYWMWRNSKAQYLLSQIPKNVVEWVYSKDMSDEEKAAHPEHETTGGYLKVLDESESSQIWWNKLPNREKNTIKSLPNFNADIFYQCTGIKVE